MNPVTSPYNAFEITRLAKTDPRQAESMVLDFVREKLPQLNVESVRINDSKVSLNSVNGVLQAPGQRYFFKFHAEENEEASLQNSEYYNAALLALYGLPLVTPITAIREPGSQFVVYPEVTNPTAFDEYEREDVRYLDSGAYDQEKVTALLDAERALARIIMQTYLQSLQQVESANVRDASLNQLFYNRLVGETSTPRLDLYYTDKAVCLSDGTTIPFNTLATMQWNINGVRFEQSFADIIENAKSLLNPDKETLLPVVVGHGDDHNGNKFLIDDAFVLFDPAFGGVQPALLSFVKSTIHNTLAHPLWLYDPKRLDERLNVDIAISGDEIVINHNWDTEALSPMRLRILELYADEVWRPLLAELEQRGFLPPYWKDYLRAAFFCCPFLVKNLIDPKNYGPAASLLALSKCIELGSRADTETIVEKFLTRIDPNTL